MSITKAEARAALVAKLRSGEETQGQGLLCLINDSKCCLGVACQVHMELTGEGVWEVANSHGCKKYLGATTYLPDEVRKFFGFTTKKGSYRTGYGPCNLAADNDCNVKSFAVIADIIESEPEGMFTNV